MIEKIHPAYGNDVVYTGQNKKPDHLFVCNAFGFEGPIFVEEKYKIEQQYSVDDNRDYRTNMKKFFEQVKATHVQNRPAYADNKITRKLTAHGPQM